MNIIDERGLVLRKARKEHKCEVFRRASIYGPEGKVCLLPVGRIDVGTRYVDYIGEAGPVSSGIPFCLSCTRAVWGVSVDGGSGPDCRGEYDAHVYGEG